VRARAGYLDIGDAAGEKRDREKSKGYLDIGDDDESARFSVPGSPYCLDKCPAMQRERERERERERVRQTHDVSVKGIFV
jgi:hypothetical protein